MFEIEGHLVGIGGRNRSGKDTLAERLIKLGYYGVSLGDITREFSRVRHGDKPDPISVANMTETSNWLRSERGPAAILEIALERYADSLKAGNTYEGLALYSLRMPVEVDFVLERHGDLIWVQTSDPTRHKRSLLAKREGEPDITLEQMLEQEKLQENPQPGLPAEVQMNIPYVQQHATIVLENEGNDPDAFIHDCDVLIEKLRKRN